MREDDTYVLRSRDEEEIARLEFQHRVWAEATRDALDMGGFGPGASVADLGCGPGFVSLELAGRVGPSGRVLAVDASERFVHSLLERAARGGFAHVEARVGDIRKAVIAPASLDAAFCRWTLMFVGEPERAVEAVAQALRPGGRFVAMEYTQFLAMALRPEGAAFARVFGGVHRLIASAGGDADLGDRLPDLMVGAGLAVIEDRTVRREGRPGDPVWRWLEGTHPNHTNLVDAGLVEPDELEAYYEEWARASRDPGAVFTAPPVRIVVARKP